MVPKGLHNITEGGPRHIGSRRLLNWPDYLEILACTEAVNSELSTGSISINDAVSPRIVA